MTDRDSIDRYFTQHIVGERLVTDMGPAGAAPAPGAGGRWLEVVGLEVALVGTAVRSLWLGDEAAAAGTPQPLPAVGRTRRRLLVMALLAWSLAIGAAAWWARGAFAS